MMVLFISVPIYAEDFINIEEGATKEEVIKLLGKPSKIIEKEEVDALEYWIWYEQDNTWVMLFEDGISTGGAGTIGDLLYGMLDLATLFDDPYMGSENGKVIKKTVIDKKLEKIKEEIKITILDARIIENILDERKAGFRYKIKNNSSATIYKLSIIIYFYDRNKKIFYEEERTPIYSESWTDPIILKPNYSVILPEADEDMYSTVDKMDLEEWDEGKIKIQIEDIEIDRSNSY
jgi:hypothetical protein